MLLLARTEEAAARLGIPSSSVSSGDPARRVEQRREQQTSYGPGLRGVSAGTQLRVECLQESSSCQFCIRRENPTRVLGGPLDPYRLWSPANDRAL